MRFAVHETIDRLPSAASIAGLCVLAAWIWEKGRFAHESMEKYRFEQVRCGDLRFARDEHGGLHGVRDHLEARSFADR